MSDILAEIHKKLGEIRAAFEKRQHELKTNRDAAIAYAHFFTDTLKCLAPEYVGIHWYGSYSNPDVANYSVLSLQVYTTVTGQHKTLFWVYINTDGRTPPDVCTQEQIMEEVNKALARVQREAGLAELM